MARAGFRQDQNRGLAFEERGFDHGLGLRSLVRAIGAGQDDQIGESGALGHEIGQCAKLGHRGLDRPAQGGLLFADGGAGRRLDLLGFLFGAVERGLKDDGP